MRLLSLTLALLFGLAMAGPETHQCPVHDQHGAPASAHQDASPSSHHPEKSQQQKPHCTCPQACCPSGISHALPATHRTRIVVAQSSQIVADDFAAVIVLPSRRHLLPFALAPPQQLV